MVENLTHNPKIEGSNPATSTSKRILQKVETYWFLFGSTVVENLTHNPKIEGSNPCH